MPKRNSHPQEMENAHFSLYLAFSLALSLCWLSLSFRSIVEVITMEVRGFRQSEGNRQSRPRAGSEYEEWVQTILVSLD